MLCSARELGLGEEHDGIMELAASLPLNVDVREALDLDDTVLEVNATPNRGDCMSVFGIARDYAAAQEHRYPQGTGRLRVAAAHERVFPVRIESASRLSDFLLARDSRRAPRRDVARRGCASGCAAWGINSISPIVDVTNYVMMDLGQPLHAYDLARLSKGIVVRTARPGRTHHAAQRRGVSRSTPNFWSSRMRAAPSASPASWAGSGTAIGDGTTDVLLEAAHFTPAAVVGRARRLGLFTDAGQRFERGVDPALPPIALERATALLLEIAGGEAGPVQVTRAEPEPSGRGVGAAAAQPPRATAGRKCSRCGGALRSWRAISERVEPTAAGLARAAPPHRFDVRIEEDLIEEVARLRGFDSIAESARHRPADRRIRHRDAAAPNDRLLTAMADRGYREAITYTFVDPALQRLLFPQTPALALSNPDLGGARRDAGLAVEQPRSRRARDNMRRQQSARAAVRDRQ